MSMSGIFHVHPGESPLPAIDVVQNNYSVLLFTQQVDRSGSEWLRSIEHDLGLTQDFSDFYGESIETVLSLISSFDGDRDLHFSLESTLVLVDGNSVAGGRILAGGESSIFSVIYDTGGPSAIEGNIVYIDNADSEAKLATYAGSLAQAEVVGFCVDAADAGEGVVIQTEGEFSMSNWTNIAGTVALTPGAYYYLHTGGQMRVNPPAQGTVVIVGRAMTATKFDIEINPPWEV